MLRIAGIFGAAALVWLTGASRVPAHDRLALAGVVPGAVMTQPFGCSRLVLEPFDPYCPTRHIHTGVDLAARAGTPVRAAAGGTADVEYDPGGAGLYVVVTTGDHVRVLYCHLSRATVSNGNRVIAGQVIGNVGTTGLSTGAHLHFEVQVDGRAVDPVSWLAS